MNTFTDIFQLLTSTLDNGPVRSSAKVARFTAEHKIKVLGVGGCGSNTVHYLNAYGDPSLEYVYLNTGTEAHNRCSDHKTFRLDRKRRPMTVPFQRYLVASELEDVEFRASLECTDVLFIVAGMGGRTGTQLASEVAHIARTMGIITIGIVTMPFDYETGRKQYSGLGLDELTMNVDSLIVMSNDRLIEILGDDVTQEEVFAYGNEMVKAAISAMV